MWHEQAANMLASFSKPTKKIAVMYRKLRKWRYKNHAL